MPRLRYLLPVAVVTLFLLGVSLRLTEAQINVETCPTIIEDALSAVGDNCGGLDRNSACYGNNLVQATFTEALTTDFFSRPADRSPISSISTISTTPLETALGEWGIALLSIQANLPDTLPGQNVVFMLLGETELENAVEPQDTYLPGAILDVTTSMGVDLRYQPDLNADIVGNIPGGTTISADAITADGQWLRVTVGENFGWVLTGMVTTGGDLATLGVYGPNTRTPMQAFYFRNNINGTDCTKAPDALVVQGPQNLSIDINIAGADVRMGSTALFRIIPIDSVLLGILRQLYGEDIQVGSLLQVIAIDGHVYINPDTPDEQLIEPGWTTTRCLSLPENLGLDGQANDGEVFAGCPWGETRELTPEELELFRALDGFGDGILNYTIEIPGLPEASPTPTSTPTRVPQVQIARPTSTPIPSNPTPTATWTPWPFIPSDTPLPPPVVPTCPVTFPMTIVSGDIAGLRAAVTAGNNPACAPAVINLDGEGSYSFADAVDGVNALPVITGNITINGVGSFLSSSTSGVRLLEIAPGGVLQMGSVNIQSFASGGNGGAILNAGTLALNFADMRDNIAVGSGGAIYNSGSLTVDNSTFALNAGLGGGGGIYNTGSATVTNSTFDNNSTFIGGAYSGPPRFAKPLQQASAPGGGIYNANALTLVNSTLYANRADGASGGNIYNTGTVNATFVTIAGGITFTSGGNIGNGGTFNLNASLVAGFGDTSSCIGGLGAVNSYTDDASCINMTVLPSLGLDNFLSYLGGNTSVLNLQSGSPVLDVLADCLGVFNDQAQNARPLDGNFDTISQCDPGAVELDPSGFYAFGT